jgi:hypothetical protein
MSISELQQELSSVADDVEAEARSAATSSSPEDDLRLDKMLRILCSCSRNARAEVYLSQAISIRVTVKSSAALAQLQNVRAPL